VVDPFSSHEINATGTLNVLIAARDAKVERVVYASSSSVYGDSPELPKREDMPTNPLSPYAASKLTGEIYCCVFHRVYGLPTVALRYFNVFGPRQDPSSQYAAVVPRFITAALRGEPLTIYGDGLQSRDFTYISDVVTANLLACSASGAAGQVVNVSCGGRSSLLDLAGNLEGLLGNGQIRARYESPRPGDVKHSQADIRRAAEVLGYQPLVDFETGLAYTVEWYQRHAAEIH
jgi:UDP-N-acetylglucosamine/UDP-N-acetyl-alpha-D-glucosaminouronate 4-epimerase